MSPLPTVSTPGAMAHDRSRASATGVSPIGTSSIRPASLSAAAGLASESSAPRARLAMAATNRIRRLAGPALMALALIGGMTAGGVQAAELSLEISGLATDGGPQAQVMVAVFADAQDWLKKPVAVRRVAAQDAVDGRLTLRLSDLPEGPVAISVFQDLNGNGRLDTNPVGMPLEPFAFSRQAQGNFGPPRFEQAVLDAGTTRHAIQLPAMP